MNKGTIAVVSSAMLAVVAWITASAEEKALEHNMKRISNESDYSDCYDTEYDESCYENEGGIR